MAGHELSIRPTTRSELIKTSPDGVRNLTARAAQVGRQKKVVVDAIKALAVPGVSLDAAIKAFGRRLKNGQLSPGVMDALKAVTKEGRDMPGRGTLFEWIKADRDGGKTALAPNHKGRVRVDYGWETLAVDLYNQPSSPSMAAVTRDLRRLYAFDCTYDQVSGYLSALPTSLGKLSPARLGPRLHKLQQKPFVQRHTRNLKPGSIYMADGYRLDVYLAHPVTGKIWRAEIMHVIDLYSRYLVGYRIMANERGYDIMTGWAQIFENHDHVPPLLYVDNGSGYKNQLADDEMSGYYIRAGVQFVIHSLPRNPHGKGHIEQYHRIVRDDFLKTWKPQFYCGDDMSDEVRNHIVNECNNNRMSPPSVAEFVEAYDAWIKDDYHFGRPHPEDKRVTRGAMWAGLDPITPHATAEEIARPQESRRVQRGAVQLNNRRYQHPDLYAWNGQDVFVEYDVLNHAMVTVRDAAGRLICDAPMVEAIGVVGDSFLADMEVKANDAAIKRLEKKIAEQKARAGLLIDADAVVDGTDALIQTQATASLPAPIEIDLLTFE